VIKETLRLYPTVPTISKKSTEDEVLGGYFLPRETSVLISIMKLHRNPKYWTDAETFDPLRWQRIQNAAVNKDEQDEGLPYFPFGFGPRVCLGSRMAMTEARTVLASLAQRYEFETISKEVEEQVTITLRPAGLRVLMKPRTVA